MRYRQSIRHVAGLVSANYSAGPTSAPAWAKSRRRAKGARAKGFAYERCVERELKRHGCSYRFNQWIRFHDTNGTGFAQPDVIIDTPHGIYILECKYTYTDMGWEQLERLYIPLVRHLHPGRPVFGVEVCKVLDETRPLVVGLSFLDSPPPPRLTWHFLGR